MVHRAAEAARAPAVRVARRAWAARVEVADVAVVVGGGGNDMTQENRMKWQTVFLIMLLVGAAALSLAAAQTGQAPATQPAQTQKSFATPQEAADALVQAAAKYDLPELASILGPGSEDLISSEDAVRDKNNLAQFASEAQQKKDVTVDPKNANRAVVSVGENEWPLPIPLVRKSGKWSFDTAAGRKEVLLRRIGSNELDAIQICRGYVDAQQEYALEKHDGAEVNQYAQKVISTSGKHDGLVWRNPDGSLGGPIAAPIAEALTQGYTDKSKPYHGYYFKILKGQGPAAPLGRLDYVVEGAMIGGFALAAAPAEYRVTGVQTFIVNQSGTVYQKDLGPNTLDVFKNMELFDPDPSWRPTNDSW